MTSMPIEGMAEPGFAPVRDAFSDNFTGRGEVGAAVCVYHRGHPVVDLWGGEADATTGRAWDGDTLAVMDSVTKAVTSACFLMLVDRGEIELDAPLARYWPEFAPHGKQEITVRQVLSHQAGVPGVDRWISLSDLEAWTPLVQALEQQQPYWQPGTAHGYHGVTIGWLLGEPIRRITGMTPGAFLEQVIRPRLDLDLWIGLPESEEARMAAVIRPDLAAGEGIPSGDERYEEFYRRITEFYADPEFLDQYLHPAERSATFFDRPLTIPQRVFGPMEVGDDFNSRRWHAAEIPSANGIGSARSLARLGAALVGEVDGTRLVGADLMDQVVQRTSSGPDRALLHETAWGLGFNVPGGPLFPGAARGREFGAPGANGTLLYADLDEQLAIGYMRNHLLLDVPDPRAWPLVEAARDCVDQL